MHTSQITNVYDNINTNESVGEIYNMLMPSCTIQRSNNKAKTLSLTLMYLMKVFWFQKYLGKPLPNMNYTFFKWLHWEMVRRGYKNSDLNVMKTKLNSHKFQNFVINLACVNISYFINGFSIVPLPLFFSFCFSSFLICFISLHVFCCLSSFLKPNI